ncbi:hypothetical protein [Prevotella pallens]|uniref:hypothetical protein n=1 Tax=Prevotella pallens TaxID=60133 RepID=UPI001CAB458F|nr:hypothetical protein [Prevotella pallens]MBF1465265.1 hypothetical protein [Prevotella pallens]
MKKVIFALLGIMFLVSCNQNSEEDLPNDQVVINTKVTHEKVKQVNHELEQLFSSVKNTEQQRSITRSAPIINEEEVIRVLSPLSIEGEDLRNQLLKLEKEGKLDLTSTEISELHKMKAPELAGFAYFVAQSKMGNGTMKAIKARDLIDCVSVAVGFSAGSSLWGVFDGTASLVSAKTAWNIGRAFISRTLGWIGVAYAIYEYVDCLKSKGAFN